MKALIIIIIIIVVLFFLFRGGNDTNAPDVTATPEATGAVEGSVDTGDGTVSDQGTDQTDANGAVQDTTGDTGAEDATGTEAQ